jgi:RNA polymerase sigma-70 factor (ECF subfamily)
VSKVHETEQETREVVLHDPDCALVALAKDGVHSAFTEICARHEKMIYRILRRILMNDEDAEDALQECFLRVYSHIAKFDGRAKFSTWLTRIAINTALMTLRKRTHRPTRSIDELDESELACLLFPLQGPVNPEDQLQHSEMAAILRAAIHRLPPTLRDVTEIRISENRSVKEVAKITGISVAATKSRLLRARSLLFAELEPFATGRLLNMPSPPMKS